jgi:hypothetical protein
MATSVVAIDANVGMIGTREKSELVHFSVYVVNFQKIQKHLLCLRFAPVRWNGDAIHPDELLQKQNELILKRGKQSLRIDYRNGR